MHVLLLAPGFSPHSQRLLNSLLASGCEVSFVDGHDPQPTASGRYRFVPFPGVRGVHRLPRILRERWAPTLRGWPLHRIAARLRPDVVNVHGVDHRAFSCARGGLRPLVLNCWGSDINDLETESTEPSYLERLASMADETIRRPADVDAVLRRQRARIGYALRRAARVVAGSETMLDRCRRFAGGELPTALFRFGVDRAALERPRKEDVRRLRETIGIPAGNRVLLSVRTFQPLMGQREIVEAFARLRSDPSLPPSVLVFKKYLATDYAAGYNEIVSLVREKGLQERVFWMDAVAVDDVPLQYALADVVISYAEQDGFALSLLEAAFARRTVVCSRLPDYEATFGESFLLAPPADVDALERALRTALTEDAGAAERRRDRAARVAGDIGDRDREVGKLLRIYEEAAGGRPRHE